MSLGGEADAAATAEPAPMEEAPAAGEAPVEEAPTEEAAEEPGFPSSLKIGIGMRSGVDLKFDDATADGPTLSLGDGVVNQLNVRPLFSGQLTESIGFTFNMETTQSSVDVLDAIIQLKVADEFQVWVGQHIPAMERNNFNGPFYNNGWNLPISVHTLPFDIAGRDRGATFWGLVAGGVLKYHVSVVDLAPAASTTAPDPDDATTVLDTEGAGIGNARIAARATINLLDPENYYYTSGTYYGSQDTLALGAVVQYQKGVDATDGTDLDNDLMAFTADLLFEKVVEGSGTFTLNGGYWNFEGTGDYYQANQGTSNFGSGLGLPGGSSSYLVGVSWLSPQPMGAGHIQPNATLQIVDGDDTATVLDVGVGYIVDGFNHRWFLNFRNADPGGDADAEQFLQLGAQLQL